MKNLMSADFYKIFRNKSLWVCTILIIALAVGAVYLVDFTYKIAQDNPGLTVTVDGEEMQTDSAEFIETPKAYDFFSGAFASNITIFVAIIVSVFVGAEFGLGTIKNTATKAFSRTKIYLSKLFVSLIVSDILFIIFAGFYLLTATALWGFGTPPAGFALLAVKEVCLQLLLNMAYTSIFVAVGVVLRQSGGAIALNIGILTFSSTIVSLVDMLIQRVSGTDFAISDFLISTNVTALSNQELTNNLAIRSLLVGICYLAAALAVGLFDFNKRDIK